MRDLGSRLEQAREHVQPAWDRERWAAVRRRMMLRRRNRRLAAGATAAIGVLGALWLARPAWQLGDPPALARRATTAESRLDDGSLAEPVGSGSVVRRLSEAPGLVVVEVAEGTGRFSVTPNPARTFRVLAGAVTVEVLGTGFLVERLGARARVAVERGRVRVLAGGDRVELGAGESGVFPRASPAAPQRARTRPQRVASARADAPSDIPTPVHRAEKPEPPTPAPASPPAAREVGPAAEPGPTALLEMADRARERGRPAEAIPALRQVVAKHRQDPRAPLAAFTLGRVLSDLERPTEAARAFALVQELAPPSTLVEDALSREVEAWARAGDAARARARGLDYLARYPAGGRVSFVKRHAGLP